MVSGATLPADTNSDILGITMITPNDVWAVGDVGDAASQRTLAEHWNGTQWSVVPSPNTENISANPINTLYSVAIVGPNDVWAVGRTSSKDAGGYHETTLTEQWNGTAWHRVPSPTLADSVDYDTLIGVAAVPSGTLWATPLRGRFLRNTTG